MAPLDIFLTLIGPVTIVLMLVACWLGSVHPSVRYKHLYWRKVTSTLPGYNCGRIWTMPIISVRIHHGCGVEINGKKVRLWQDGRPRDFYFRNHSSWQFQAFEIALSRLAKSLASS